MAGQSSLEEMRMDTEEIAWTLLENGYPMQTNGK